MSLKYRFNIMKHVCSAAESTSIVANRDVRQAAARVRDALRFDPSLDINM